MSLGGTTFHMGVFGLPIRKELTRVGRLKVQQRCLIIMDETRVESSFGRAVTGWEV